MYLRLLTIHTSLRYFSEQQIQNTWVAPSSPLTRDPACAWSSAVGACDRIPGCQGTFPANGWLSSQENSHCVKLMHQVWAAQPTQNPASLHVALHSLAMLDTVTSTLAALRCILLPSQKTGSFSVLYHWGLTLLNITPGTCGREKQGTLPPPLCFR